VVISAAGPFLGSSLDAIARSLRDGSTDPVTLTEQALAAIDAAQPVLNAFVTVDHEGARRAAIVARDELAAGRDRGLLHGVPVGVKDIVDTAGLRTTMGARHFATHVPESDALVVTRLREAGAIIAGKTTTHQYAYGPTGDRSANGAGANPHDPARMAGGSSAGSAAAVAAGLVPLAVGSDTGGSVRIPAALCGVTGIRPSPGRIPTEGVFPLSWSLDSVGPIAADVAGTAVGWQVFAGVPLATLPAVDPASLRVGLVTAAWFDRLDDTVRSGLSTVVSRLRAAGASVSAVAMPDGEELYEVYRIVQSGEVASIHHQRLLDSPELFDPEILARLRVADEIPARDYARARRRLDEVRADAGRRLDGLDLLLLPTVPVLAPPIGVRDAETTPAKNRSEAAGLAGAHSSPELTPAKNRSEAAGLAGAHSSPELGGGWTSPRDALLAFTAPFSVLGLPAISIPVPGSGLPVGAQLVGRPGQDERLLAAALAVERLL
jgi:Asp-tRNA(Asn)/Glu-tRNA(Gln) amidotransferase A subunit family amidase